MYPFPNLPDTPSTGRQLLLDIADQTHGEYAGPDVHRRAHFAAGGSAIDLLRRRHQDAPWHSPMPPLEAIARLEQNHAAIRLLRRLVGAGPLAVHDDWFADFSQANVKDLEHSNANDKEYVLYLRSVTFQSGQDLGRVMDGLTEERPIDMAYKRLVQKAGLVAHHGPVTLSYVGCTVAATAYARQQQADKTRVAILVKVAQQLRTAITYQAFELDRIAFDGKRVSSDIEHVETAARLLLGPLALNSSPGGPNHIVTLSRKTSVCIGKLRETTFRPAAELLAGNDGWDVALDERLKIEVAQAYAIKMPKDFRQLMPSRVFKLAIAQSSELQTWHGLVPSAILGKDISAGAFEGAIPFYSVESPGRGPRLIAEAERHILGEIIATPRGRLAFRGPFRNLWEVLRHVLWKLARIWLADWLKIVRPVAVFAMGGQVVRALLDGVISESPRTTRVPIFRLAGRPKVVAFGNGPEDVCLMVPCIDPGKAAYNPLASPFEQELIVIAKAIHSLAVSLVLRLWRGEGTLAKFLSEILLPRLLACIDETGLGACGDRVANDLARVYSTIEGPADGPGSADFGRRAREFKETGARRSLAAVGAVGSPAREAWVAGLMAEVEKETTLGRALLLSDILPRLAFGKIGDATWVNCLRTAAEDSDVWESMKSWGTSPTDSMTLAERRAYTAKRFPRTAMPTSAVIAANDARVAAIGAPGYPLLAYDKQSYEYTCVTCQEVFLCDDRGRGGDRHEHKHNGEAPNFARERVVALTSVAPTLCALEAKGKLLPLHNLVREVEATVVVSSSAAASVSILIAKNAVFSTEELDFLAVVEHIRASGQATPTNPSPPLSRETPERCAVRCLRANDRRHQHKHGRVNVELRAIAGAAPIQDFAQFPVRYQLALLSECRKVDQAVGKIFDKAGMRWRDVVLWSSTNATPAMLAITLAPTPSSPQLTSPGPSPSQSPLSSPLPSLTQTSPSSSSSTPPPPPPAQPLRPPKRKRADYSAQYARLDALQAQHAGPELLSVEAVRRELARDLPPDQAKTARVGWFRRQEKRRK
ncbi:hypothetical protein HDU89_008559 [Geranomyces variabilis]|nr:hypothetical protein HDU89_008559 [Geranomyces variabilis]